MSGKRWLIILVLLLGMGCATAEGRTIYVDDDGPADFNNIQAAINDSNDGDTIIVQPGVYREYASFHGKNITLTSTNPGDSNVVASTIIEYGAEFAGTEDPNCTLTGFKFNFWIGGNHTHATISHCLLSNSADPWGIAIRDCDGTISNCVIVDNWPSGDAVSAAIVGCHGLIKNCTIAHNFSGIFVSGGGTTTIENCIIYDNRSVQVGVARGGMVNILYSDVEGGMDGIPDLGTVNWGPGNIDTDPCFVQLGEWYGELNGDYHLLPDSPCINAGDPNYVAEPNETDLDGKPRIIGGRIDMGAYEYQGPQIIYVDADANSANDGSSWGDAYNYLQDALVAASSGDEIWVAEGIYKPDEGVGIMPGDRTATFQLKNGVVIKGGYAGFGQPDPNARHIDEYQTILSGDLDGNDVDVNNPADLLDEPTRGENSYHVVTAYEVDETTCLEGFTISGGNANGKSGFSYTGYDGNDGGGGMLINASWPTEHSSPIISNCLFRDNRAVCGAGIYSYRGPATIENCIFEDNIAERYGGGIDNVLGGTKIVRSCLFIDNQAFTGGGLYYFYSGATVTNCVFAGNFAHFDGSAIVSPTGTVTNCTFYGNHVDDDTAVVVNGMGELYIINSILWDDTHTEGYYEIAAWMYVYISHCDVRGGEAGVYIHSDPWGPWGILNWGPGNIDADPCFVDPGYWDPNGTPADANDDFWVEGDYHLLEDSPCIDAGDPNYVAEPNETDLDGKPRIIGGRIDMGAYEYNPPIPAEVRIVPRTINLASKGKWITCYIRLGEDYNVADIDPYSIFLEDEIQAQSLLVDEQEQIALVRFSRLEVQDILDVGDVELTITGQLTDGTVFEGADIIRVIDKGGGKSAK